MAKYQPGIVVYSVGVDITPEQYQELIQKIGDWFAQNRNTKEPVAQAKYYIDCCLKGVLPRDGKTPWQSHARSSLATRIKMACRFDLATMQPLLKGTEKTREKHKAEKARKVRQAERAAVDKNLPKEYQQALTTEGGVPADPATLTYGDDPLQLFTTAELKRRDELRDAYLKDYPELRGVAARAKLDMLLDNTLFIERMRLRKAKDQRQSENDIANLIRQNVELERALDIHPDQVRQRKKQREGGTIGEAVRRMEDLGGIYELRQKWFAEELLLLYQAYHTPSPRTDREGYQLDDVGLFGVTRSRTVTCPNCGELNFAGLRISEIEAYLARENWARELSAEEVKALGLEAHLAGPEHEFTAEEIEAAMAEAERAEAEERRALAAEGLREALDAGD